LDKPFDPLDEEIKLSAKLEGRPKY